MSPLYTPIPTAADIILSVRAQIPDPAPDDDPALDGNAFRVDTLLRWINDAGRLIALAAPIVQDWFGFPTEAGQDVYELPSYITSVEQAWYNLLPLTRSPEGDAIFTSKTTGRSWWMGPHSLHARPRLHIWPAPSESGATTTLASSLGPTDASINLTSAAGFQEFGYAIIKPGDETEELIRYATVSGNQLQNILRGQGGTQTPSIWGGANTIRECNLFGKCFRLPRPLKKASDPLEIPQGLWPLVELYILSKVRESEQDHGTSLQLLNTFNQATQAMSDKPQLKGLRQGMQVKVGSSGPNLFRGRIFIP